MNGERLAALGFDVSRLRFALRTALAACLALLAGWLLGLEHPQWSAMTVWAASQPLRGQLIEKSFFRAAGTVVGVCVGVLLVVASSAQPVVMIVGIALWMGLCAGVGNLQRSYLSYGTMLAGYSAAMVALLDTAHPDRVFALGTDRLLTVLVGVSTALVVGLLVAPGRGGDDIDDRVRKLAARVLRDMAFRLSGGTASPRQRQQGREQYAILSEMAAIEEALDPHAAGSLRSRRSVRVVRALLSTQISALLWLNGAPATREDARMSSALEQAAKALEAAAGAEAEEVAAIMVQAAELSAADPALHEVILPMATALRDQLGAPTHDERSPERRQPVILHRDWVGAREALIRATGTLLVMGGLWLATGWSAGPYLILGTAIMISVFSTFENPAKIMLYVFRGHLLGVIGALACRWLVWPLATSEIELVFLTMPFILLGAFILAHRRTMIGGFDYSMAMLLLLQPVYPLAGTFPHWLTVGGAVLAGPLTALVAYRLVYPADAKRRIDTLIAMMINDVQAIARTAKAPEHRAIWRARLYHRMLRLVRWAEASREREIAAVDGSLAILALGNAALRMQDLLREPGLEPGTARCLTAALRRIAGIGREPGRVGRALEMAALRLSRGAPADAALIRIAAGGLASNPAFFGRVARFFGRVARAAGSTRRAV